MAFDAYVNHDMDTARSLFRSHLIESARSINADMDKQLNEEFNLDQDEDFADDVKFDEDEVQDDELPATEDDYADSDDFDESEVSAPEWQEMQDKLDELEAMFKELSGGAVEDHDEDFLNSDDEQDEILFGDEETDDELKESFDLKSVKVPDMTKETNVDNTKSPTAGVAKSPVPGVSAANGWTKDGTVKGSNVKLDTPDAQKPEVKDNNNVQSSGKSIYQNAKNTARTKEDAGVNTKSTIKPR